MPFAIIGLLIPLALIVVVVRSIRGRAGLETGAATLSLRRFFQYLILLGLLIAVALGLGGLLSEALAETFPSGSSISRLGADDLPLAVTFLVVAGPLFVVMAVWTRGRLAADPEEKDALGWAFYLTVALLISLTAVMTAGWEALDWALSDGELSTRVIGEGIAWAAVWAAHWLIARVAIEPARMQAQQIVGAAAGLGVLVASFAMALNAALESLYAEAFDVVYRDDLLDQLREAAPFFVVGVLVWWWYWLMNGARSERSSLWSTYVLLIGVLGGLVTVLVAAGGLIATTLDWYIGDPEATRAARHFDLAPAWVTALLIGASVWLYHRFILGAGAGERIEVHRAYDYLMSGVGLVAGAAGLGTAVVALLDTATDSAGATDRFAEDELLVGAITLFVVGAPLWGVMWSGLKRRAAGSPEPELGSVSRRIYLFVLFGVGAVAAVVALIVFVFVIVRDLFDGNLGTGSVRDAEASIGVLLSALGVAGYHWTVYRHDRSLLADKDGGVLREVLLVCFEGESVAAALRQETGARVLLIGREEVAGSLDPDDVVEALRGRSASRLLVVQQDLGGFDVVPLDKRRQRR